VRIARLLLLILVILLVAPAATAADNSVWTQRNDNQRTGAQLAEKELTPASVNTARFGRLFALMVDGTIAAQPLYVPQVEFDGVPKDVLYVATRKNKIYAFDVGTPLLEKRLLKTLELKDEDGRGAQPFPGMENWFPGDPRATQCGKPPCTVLAEARSDSRCLVERSGFAVRRC